MRKYKIIPVSSPKAFCKARKLEIPCETHNLKNAIYSLYVLRSKDPRFYELYGAYICTLGLCSVHTDHFHYSLRLGFFDTLKELKNFISFKMHIPK